MDHKREHRNSPTSKGHGIGETTTTHCWIGKVDHGSQVQSCFSDTELHTESGTFRVHQCRTSVALIGFFSTSNISGTNRTGAHRPPFESIVVVMGISSAAEMNSRLSVKS